MVLDLPGGLFGQDDVRETGVSTTAVTGTLYYSQPGIAFKAKFPDSDDVLMNGAQISMTGNAISLFCNINLPQGAVVITCQVYGVAAGETWELKRRNVSSGSTGGSMASGNIDSEDTSIVNATIDNQNFSYLITTSSLDSGDVIDSVVITYTI